MRLLWVVIVLALFQCNNGQEESSTVSEDLIKELFANDTTFENKSGGDSSDLPLGGETPSQSSGGETPNQSSGGESFTPSAGGDTPNPPLPSVTSSGNPNGAETTCSSCAAIAEDPTLTPKVSNVSRLCESPV